MIESNIFFRLGGIGISSCIVTLFVAIYYNVIITWCIFYFVNSFRVSFLVHVGELLINRYSTLVPFAMGHMSNNPQRNCCWGMRQIVGNFVLLVPRNVGRSWKLGRQRRFQMVDRNMLDGRVDNCLLHCDERHPELRKSKQTLAINNPENLQSFLRRLFTSPHFFHMLSWQYFLSAESR